MAKSRKSQFGVLRPLEEVDFREGEVLLLRVEKFDISKFYGAFGEGSMDEFETFEEEAQMGRCGLRNITAYLARHLRRD